MPMGKGTYGSKVGRPPKKEGEKKMTAAQKKLPPALRRAIAKKKAGK